MTGYNNNKIMGLKTYVLYFVNITAIMLVYSFVLLIKVNILDLIFHYEKMF